MDNPELDTLKRNPFFCKICGLAASMHTMMDWGNGVLRVMCSSDIESDLDPTLVKSVLDGRTMEIINGGYAR